MIVRYARKLFTTCPSPTTRKLQLDVGSLADRINRLRELESELHYFEQIERSQYESPVSA